MKYYPIFVRLTGRKCVVIGGGTVAAQKVRSLLEAGGAVIVISPQLTEDLRQMARSGRIQHLERAYRPGDIADGFIAFAATGRDDVDRQIAAEAAASGVLLNVVDRPQLCDFISPAVVVRDDLLVAISTSGTSPAMAKQLRQKLEGELGPEYAVALRLLGRLRTRLRELDIPAGERAKIFDTLVESPLLELLRTRRFDDVDDLLSATVGAELTLSSLEIERTEAS